MCPVASLFETQEAEKDQESEGVMIDMTETAEEMKIREGYMDIDGDPISLENLVRDDPGWACSRIRHMSAEVKRLRGEHEEMASTQCLHPEALVGDECGTPYCQHRDDLERLRDVLRNISMDALNAIHR